MLVKDQQPTGSLEYMIIGEAPGENEEKKGIPFIGRAGDQLTDLLYSVGISRDKECYITNVTDKRPSNNNFSIYYKDSKRKKPTDDLLLLWEQLRRKIRALRPKIIITLGNEATKGVMGLHYHSITKWRGSILNFGETKVIPTIHPSAILKGGGTSHWYLPAVWHDLKRTVKEKDSKEPAHKVEMELIKDPKALDHYFAINAETQGVCAFDIETTIKGGERIRCIGFANNPKLAWVVPLQDLDLPAYFEMWEVIKKWMTGTQIRWIAQNGYGFDINYILRRQKFTVQNYYFDTFVAHHVLHPEMPHDLGFLTSYYTRIPYYKNTSNENLYLYNAKDAVSTFIVAEKELKELHDRGLWDLYYTYYHPLITALREMSHRGVRIDKSYQKELKTTLKGEISELQFQLDSIYGKHCNTEKLNARLKALERISGWTKKQGKRRVSLKTVKVRDSKSNSIKRKRISSFITSTKKEIKKKKSLNVNSNTDMPNFLYKVLGLPVQRNQGKVTTDELALDKLYIRTEHPFLKTMIKLRKTKKSMSDYGKMKVDRDDRVRTTYSFAETGRLKSGKFEAK